MARLARYKESRGSAANPDATSVSISPAASARAGRCVRQRADAAQRDQPGEAHQRPADVIIEFGEPSGRPVDPSQLPDPVRVRGRQPEPPPERRGLVSERLGLGVPPGEAGQETTVDQHPPALERVPAGLRDGRHPFDVDRHQGDLSGLEAVGDKPLMRAEQQVLVVEPGGDVEHRPSRRHPVVQEVRPPQGELAGDQGRAQGLGVPGLFQPVSPPRRWRGGSRPARPAASRWRWPTGR